MANIAATRISSPGRFAKAIADTDPFRLFCKTGLARTSHGIVLFLVWRVAADSENESCYELFLNPHEQGSLHLLSSVAQQSHLKAVIVDSARSTVVNRFEFDNVYGFDELSATVTRTIRDEPSGDFQLAKKEFTRGHRIEDLLDT